MEEEIISKKLYNRLSVIIAIYMGGPIAGAVLMRRNFLNLNKNRKATITLIFGIVSTVFLMAVFLSIPGEILDKIPNMLFPMVYAGLMYVFVEKYQGAFLKEHKEKGGIFYKTGRAVLVGLLYAVMVLGIIFAYFFLTDSMYDFDAKTYDRKIEQFVKNEKESLAVFDRLNRMSTNNVIDEFQKGKVLWEKNLVIAREILEIENLPDELKMVAENLKIYSELRIVHFDLVIKTFAEDTDVYSVEIDRVIRDIDKVLFELNN